jgi:hypothetical protein
MLTRDAHQPGGYLQCLDETGSQKEPILKKANSALLRGSRFPWADLNRAGTAPGASVLFGLEKSSPERLDTQHFVEANSEYFFRFFEGEFVPLGD